MKRSIASGGHLNRRDFTKSALSCVASYSLYQLFSAQALANPFKVEPAVHTWLKQLNELGLDMRAKKITQLQWQAQTEAHLSRVDIPELLKTIDFENILPWWQWQANKTVNLGIDYSKIEGLPKLTYANKMFCLKEGAHVRPHGHDNMVSLFLVLKGSFHLRHFERLKDEKTHYLIKPTIDREFPVGGFSTISDYRDNIHWLTAKSERAYVLNIHLRGVGEKATSSGRVYLDPRAPEVEPGLIRAPKLTDSQARHLFG